jgi:hypothetical protein
MSKIPADEDDIMRRAYAAHSRTEFANNNQPNNGLSGVEEHGGEWYAVLRTINGVLSVYHVHDDGSLEGLKDWPASIQ